MTTDIDYHLHRARTERDVAYRSANAAVSDVHMLLSALHLQRALLLQEVQQVPVGNVSPIRQQGHGLFTPITEVWDGAAAGTQAIPTCSA